MQDESFEGQMLAPPRRTGRRLVLALVLLLLVAGGLAAAAWQFPAGQRQMRSLLGREAEPVRMVNVPTAPAAPGAVSPPPAPTTGPAPQTLPPVGGIDARLALLEERLARLDLQAEAASGNAARAEGLLIAFAARRALDRGAKLGFLEDQLRLRFADAQPNAVQTLVQAAAAPVTLDGLYAQLDALAPALTETAIADDGWSRLKQEVSNLFVIRHQSGPATSPAERLSRAKLMLAAGKTSEAVNEIGRLPGAAAAQDWIAEARRYEASQRALDLIETTALLDSNRLKDGEGSKVEQPSPLTGPVN